MQLNEGKRRRKELAPLGSSGSPLPLLPPLQNNNRKETKCCSFTTVLSFKKWKGRIHIFQIFVCVLSSTILTSHAYIFILNACYVLFQLKKIIFYLLKLLFNRQRYQCVCVQVQVYTYISTDLYKVELPFKSIYSSISMVWPIFTELSHFGATHDFTTVDSFAISFIIQPSLPSF